ncbi:CRISPR-associated endonuclease Cas2 [Elstera sp.]|jgi:CRISPR-associated protein Cas2|uniref:CRISPR-associated endonuclease Cas2 n=1 Tax=Elstera sp. TaxID=1916664 RepID=UPI0037BFB6E8
MSSRNERFYIVTYDIADPKRWRRVFKTLEAYGEWLQLSVFQCRLTARRRAALAMRLDREIKPSEDHVLILDIGPATEVDLRIESLGKSFQAIDREARVI